MHTKLCVLEAHAIARRKCSAAQRDWLQLHQRKRLLVVGRFERWNINEAHASAWAPNRHLQRLGRFVPDASPDSKGPSAEGPDIPIAKSTKCAVLEVAEPAGHCRGGGLDANHKLAAVWQAG